MMNQAVFAAEEVQKENEVLILLTQLVRVLTPFLCKLFVARGVHDDSSSLCC